MTGGEHFDDAEWTGFLDSLDFGSLAPADYARYRPAVVDGLSFFQTLEGVVADVSSKCRPDWVLMRAMVGQLAAESGQRTVALPFSRQFATHLSTLDLTQLMMSAPLIGSRQWLGVEAGLLRSSTGWRHAH